MSELEQNLSNNALMLVVEMLAAKELYDSTRTTEDFEFLCEKRKALESYIAELEEKQRWIPVSERLPEAQIIFDGFDTIVEFETIEGRVEKVVQLLFWDCRDKTWNEDICDEGFVNVTGCVTHWRERPTPPEVYGKESEE
jgi:hypothetical protein